MANGRRSKNLIRYLVNDRGKEVREGKEIEEEILSFFLALYGPSTEDKPFVEGADWSPISEQERRSLDSPFSIEEIRKVIFECDRNKSPSLDGFSMGFYQENWERIKPDMERVFKEFFERGITDRAMNETFVCLIPKKRMEKVKDFRPISLVTSLYKIIVKVLATRLKKGASLDNFGVPGSFY